MWLLIGGTWLFASELRASPMSPRVFFCLLSSPPPLSANDGSSSLAILITSKKLLSTCQGSVEWQRLTNYFPTKTNSGPSGLNSHRPLRFQIFWKYLYNGHRCTWFLVTRYFKLKMNFVFLFVFCRSSAVTPGKCCIIDAGWPVW